VSVKAAEINKVQRASVFFASISFEEPHGRHFWSSDQVLECSNSAALVKLDTVKELRKSRFAQDAKFAEILDFSAIRPGQ
jgi:hypothetical protein